MLPERESVPQGYGCVLQKNRKERKFGKSSKKSRIHRVNFMHQKVVSFFTMGVLCVRMLITFFEFSPMYISRFSDKYRQSGIPIRFFCRDIPENR